MSAHVFPAGPRGRWGLGLMVAFAALFALKASGAVPLPTFVIFGIGIIGAILGVVAVTRGERSPVLVMVGGLITTLLLFWLAGELLFPH